LRITARRPPAATCTRRVLSAVAVVALCAGLPACSQGARQQLADDIAASLVRRTGDIQTGRLTLSVRPVRSVAPAVNPGGTLAVAGVAVDAQAGRAALVGPGDRTVVLFEPTTIYARRLTTSPADKRLWARLELDRLPDVRDIPTLRELVDLTHPGNIVVVGPVLLARLLAGVLTGSIRVRETDPDGNRRITFNASISKAERKNELGDDAKDATKRQLRSLAIKDDIHGGEVVLRKDGTLGLVAIRFRETPDKLTTIELEARMVLDTEPRPSPSLDAPPRGSTVRVPNLSTLEGAVIDQLAPRGAPTLPAVPGIAVVGAAP
jgi:hypothetical protein